MKCRQFDCTQCRPWRDRQDSCRIVGNPSFIRIGEGLLTLITLLKMQVAYVLALEGRKRSQVSGREPLAVQLPTPGL